MIKTIGNDSFSASVDTLGAELKSFYLQANDDEIIWQSRPEIWAGSAPILFPVIGRLLNGSCFYKGKQWQIPKHGLVKQQKWTVLEHAADRISFRTFSNEFTRQFYPDEYIFDAEFAIAGISLKVSYVITNTGAEEMYFSVGSHPGISLPMENTRLEDYYIASDRIETCGCYRLSKVGLLSSAPEKRLNGKIHIPLTKDIFLDDAVFLPGIVSTEICVGNDVTGRYVTVKTGGATDLGIWAKPEAPYVCIEPWFGYDDTEDHDGVFVHKPGILKLLSGLQFSTSYEICVGKQNTFSE